MQTLVPLNVADIEASTTVDTSPPSHQLFQENVVSKSNIEHPVDRELLDVFVELSLGPWESIQDHSLGRLRLLNFLIDDLNHNFVTDQPTSFNNASDGFDQVFVETTTDGTLQYFSDLITSGDVIVIEIFPEEFGIGALADPWSSKEKEELLFGSRKILKNSVGKLEHPQKKKQLISINTNISSSQAKLHHSITITFKKKLSYEYQVYNGGDRPLKRLLSLVIAFLLILLIIIEMIRIQKLPIRWRFGTEALNLRITDRDPITKQRVDGLLDRYGHIFRAFVLKRRLLRSQIWPKIHVIDQVPQSEKPHLNTQALFSIKKSMRDEVMMAIAKNDPTKINSAFIISNFSEDHFKEMLDEYVGKVLVCGKTPKDPEAQARVENKAQELFKMFYFGQKRSPLERELEVAYLSAKQFKSIRSDKFKVSKSKEHLAQGVVWTERDQRILEEKQNWQPTDPNLSDLNFRTYFEPLEYPSRCHNFLKCQKLIKEWTFVDDLVFRWSTSKYYNPSSSKYFDWVLQKLFVRIMNHLKSTEFTSILNVPHDYMIQAQMMQIHIWLVIDRLKKINTLEANTLAQRLKFTLNMEVVRSAQSLNVKKSNLLVTTLERMLELNNTILDLHFNKSEVTKDNPYKGIDAMVWSIAFAEKVHRYADEIYLFAEYLVRNVEHLQKHTQQDIFNGIVEFDPYLTHPHYRKLIEKVNPPLSAQQFQKQFNSNSKDKDYYYSKIQKEIEDKMTYTPPTKIDTSFSFSELLEPLRRFRVKYSTVGSLDHYDSMQEQKKKMEQFDRKGTWKSQKDAVKEIHSEFQSLQALKNKRRRLNDQEKNQKK